MTVEYIRYQIPDSSRTAFENGYIEAAKSLDASPYCLGYELSACVEEPGDYILRILWTSTSDHLTKFRGSPEFQRFFQAVSPFVGFIQEMRHYEPTLVRTPEAR
jgi:quinol monooxygenase YgiN